MWLPGTKQKSNIDRLAVMLLTFAFGAFLWACGGGKKQDVGSEGDVSIDQLLGIESQEQPQEEQKQANPDEDEVLKLLGISEEGKGETQAAQGQAPDLQSLQQKVQQLENELREKERLIEDLRQDLAAKDRQLEELQAQGQSLQAAKSATMTGSRVSGSFRQRYQAALDLYNRRQYRQAIEAFSALLAEDPNNSLADNCQYWIGECYYGLGNYQQAIAEFEKVFAYANSNKADAALLKLGITYMRMGDRESARAQFEQLIATYPKSEFVARAQRYLNQLQ